MGRLSTTECTYLPTYLPGYATTSSTATEPTQTRPTMRRPRQPHTNHTAAAAAT